ncbi:MAG TPA: hypothetical protein VFZ34_09055 [Blastocatellia bacterium]|nr:hypothetical protein [Blastocatellia bacterium]
MIASQRERFNASFLPAKYQQFISSLQQAIGMRLEFRISETPVFIPTDLREEIQQATVAIHQQLLDNQYLMASDRAIPSEFYAPHQTAHPTFIQTDFAVTQDEKGHLKPKLVELQGCASIHAFQLFLSQEYQRHFDLHNWSYLLNGLNDESYLALLRRAIVGQHSSEEVVLMEIEPELQKTRPDFVMTEKLLGVPTVAIHHILKRGKQLFYQNAGREVPIRRIYNRVIVDELVRKKVQFNFDYRDELDVEWAGHPNWFFRLSKFSLPFLNHTAVPRSWFLNQLDKYPDDLENFVLKPLFSFAGSGVKVNITRADLDIIPSAERGDYLLMEKISYAPVIQTPEEPGKVEIRLMSIWPDDEPDPIPTLFLGRMSKGAMMGVDFNKNKTWVGSTACFFAL